MLPAAGGGLVLPPGPAAAPPGPAGSADRPLADPGAGPGPRSPAPSRPGPRSRPQRHPDPVVLADSHRRDLPAALVRTQVPHLAASASEAIGVVGPLVLP